MFGDKRHVIIVLVIGVCPSGILIETCYTFSPIKPSNPSTEAGSVDDVDFVGVDALTMKAQLKLTLG